MSFGFRFKNWFGVKFSIAVAASSTVVILLLSVATPVRGQDMNPASLDFFESKIRPVLVRECYGCHSQQTGQARGGLKLDTRQGLMLGGDSGPSIVPGDLDESPLWSAINYEDYAMPPNKQLPRSVIADFRRWIEAGAIDPRVPKSTDVAISATVTDEDIEQGRSFWSFQPPTLNPPPAVDGQHWGKGQIDEFVLKKLEQNEMQPTVDAQPHTLLRRLCFDLIGLPPSPDQIERFVATWNRDPDKAIEQTVDNLLANPAFGERWGRHWLDVARYAESTGKELNATYPHAWRYRDYVIDSFNEDKPYDRFVQEQIAGDLLPVNSDEQWAENLVATGFLAMGPKSLNETNPRQFQADLIDEQIDVTTRVFLGMSVACARCHDHKFDPIPQSDYYAMAGMFASTETYYGTLDTRQNRRPSDLILLPVEDWKDPTDPYSRKLTRADIQAIQKLLDAAKDDYRKALQQRRQQRKGEKPKAGERRIGVGAASSRVAGLQTFLSSYDSEGNPKTFCMGVQPSDVPQDSRLLIRGEVDQPGELIPRGFPQVIGGNKPAIPGESSGRLELAQWMTDASNPLTARVMVNRIWQHLIGQGLVETTENFGATGLPPTHPELLDYLALRFIENGWSMKAMIREIANSRTYRMSSQYDAANYRQDPDNKLIWRASPRRLQAEQIRDSMLVLSGAIDMNRPRGSEVSRGGTTIVRNGLIPSLYASQANRNGMIPEILKNPRQSKGQQTDRNMDAMAESTGSRRRSRRPRGGQQSRYDAIPKTDPVARYRSVYLPVARDSIPRALAVFDFAESSMVVGRRETSNTPDQGLYFLNNPRVIKLSQAFARRLSGKTDVLQEQVQLAFVAALGRPASETEISAAVQFLKNVKVVAADDKMAEKRLALFCQSLMATAEFRIIN